MFKTFVFHYDSYKEFDEGLNTLVKDKWEPVLIHERVVRVGERGLWRLTNEAAITARKVK